MLDNTERPTIFRCALMILNDGCPPNNKAYLCTYDEEPDCKECWSKYLFAIANGKSGDLNLHPSTTE